MKHRCSKWLGAFVLTLAAFVIAPAAAEAATVDVNGMLFDTASPQSNVVMANGTTMMSENFMKDALGLTVEKEGEDFSLANANRDFVITGTLGAGQLTMDTQTIMLSMPAANENGLLYLPLRQVLERFGEVVWDGANQYVKVRYDYNDALSIDEAKMAEEHLRYSMPLDEGITLDGESIPLYMTEDGMLRAEVDENGRYTALKAGEKTLIAPCGKANVLRGSTCVVEDDYLYWIEYPDPSIMAIEDQNWYLYMQERRSGARPVCIDSASFSDLQAKSGTYAEFFLDNCDFENGNIIWLSNDAANDAVYVKLYRHDTKETTVLDTFSFASFGQGQGAAVAVGAQDAFWAHGYYVDGMDKYMNVFRMNFEKGESMPFYHGYNILPYLVSDDRLVVCAYPGGNNFEIINPETGEQKSTELWVYDLSQNTWLFKVTPNLPMMEPRVVITGCIPINDHQVVVDVMGNFEAYDIPIVDLQTGLVQSAYDAEGNALRYMPSSNELKPLGSNGSMLMTTTYRQEDGSPMRVAYPVYLK